MIENSENNEKKFKRPRIGNQHPVSLSDSNTSSEGTESTASSENQGYQPRRYQPRYNNNGYQPRYNRNNGYQPRNNHYNTNAVSSSAAEGETSTAAEGEDSTSTTPAIQTNRYQRYTRPNGYQPRYNNGYNNQNGYRQNNGYRPRYNNQNGYQQNNYNNQGDNQNGGYQPRQNNGYRPRYNNQNGGYQPRQNNGYRQNNQGGYQQRPNNGYRQNNNNRPGGFQKRMPRQNQYGMPQGGKSFAPRPRRVEYEMPIPDPNEQVRLNKFMANAGICSRREADEFITQGLVKVNGNVVTELGTKITCNDVVEYDEKVVTLERKTYILLNKPKDCVTTTDDPNGRTTVLDLVKGAGDERIYPVGRLDRNTTGVLLLTNDGDLASKLTHPKYVKKKIYHVWVDKDITEDDMQAIADGIELEDGPIHADAISYATENDRNQAGIEIHSGRNRIVRRIFEKLGYHVTKLDRVY
ncbi:MAG: rRNA pseudouridine synthase, partial [Paramuribaculum sp.]|nr:rRNA pseudouridine synthase [Paramuribaculum sp.]